MGGSFVSQLDVSLAVSLKATSRVHLHFAIAPLNTSEMIQEI